MPDDELTPLRIGELLSGAPPPRVAATVADLADLVAACVAAQDGTEALRILAEYRALESQLPTEWRPQCGASGAPAAGVSSPGPGRRPLERV
ncbi:MAG TPA: hypothetical protein PLD23_08935 [Armatimonadota bacterium]|mgnify:CR=1 FL=1|nr:hypothetical protein [Armatimonadota bacterium]HQK93618.1 hypothetical protein [Armatimonadota bacterium]